MNCNGVCGRIRNRIFHQLILITTYSIFIAAYSLFWFRSLMLMQVCIVKFKSKKMNTAKINSINSCCFEDESKTYYIATKRNFLNRIHLNYLSRLRMLVSLKQYYIKYEMTFASLMIAMLFASILSFMIKAIGDTFIAG